MTELTINEVSGSGIDGAQSDVDLLDLMQIKAGDNVVSWAGITQDGDDVFLQSDIHCLGSAVAMLRATGAHVPFVHVGTDRVLFPADGLRAECSADPDRLRAIDNLTAFVYDQCRVC